MLLSYYELGVILGGVNNHSYLNINVSFIILEKKN